MRFLKSMKRLPQSGGSVPNENCESTDLRRLRRQSLWTRSRLEGERDGDGAQSDSERADIEPAVAAEVIEHPAAGQRSQRHAEARELRHRTEQRAHDVEAE